MRYRASAPLRIGLAGGGTDVSPYADRFGGAVVNATVSLYAHATIEPTDRREIELVSADKGEQMTYPLSASLPLDGSLDLLKGVYNRIQQIYGFNLVGMRITTKADVPAGSGLGTSSTMVVALCRAFHEMLGLDIEAQALARLAFDIERIYLGLPGGRQDQYAACFGGFNFMEFSSHEHVSVSLLKISPQAIHEIEKGFLLYYTGRSRDAREILEEQCRHAASNGDPLESMHRLKEQSLMMREALLEGRIADIGRILDYGFRQKRGMASGISHSGIEAMYAAALSAGATGGKISGAGGGGFMVFFCPDGTREQVASVLSAMGGREYRFRFTQEGVGGWREDG